MPEIQRAQAPLLSGNPPRQSPHAATPAAGRESVFSIAAGTGPVMTGNPGDFTICQLTEHLAGLTGTTSKCVFRPRPQLDPNRRERHITEHLRDACQ